MCLMKHVQYLQDACGEDVELNYIKTKEGKEVDFTLSHEKRATHLIKASENSPAPSLISLSKKIPDTTAIQLVGNLRREQQVGRVAVMSAEKWLVQLSV